MSQSISPLPVPERVNVTRPPTFLQRHPGRCCVLALLLGLGVGGAVAVWTWSEALQARREMEAATGSEVEARQAAEDVAEEETDLRVRAQRELYLARVGQVELLWQANQVEAARKLLLEPAPWADELRGWEWRYLVRRAHGEQRVLSQNDWVYGLSVRSGGRQLAVARGPAPFVFRLPGGTRKGAAALYADRGDEPTREISHPGGAVMTVAYDPDGRRLAQGTSDGYVQLLDPESGRPIRSWRREGEVTAIAWHPRGAKFAAGGTKGIALFTAAGGEPQPLAAHPDAVAALAFHPNGKTLATAGDDQTIRLIDPESGETRKLMGHRAPVKALAYSPDGGRLVSADEDGTCIVRDGGTGDEIRRLNGIEGSVHAVVFTPDGKSLLTAGSDRVVRVWDAETGRLRWVFRGHAFTVRALAIDPEGRWVASGSQDRTVRVWDLTRHPDGRVVPFDSRVNALVFDASSQTVRAVSTGGRVVTWELATGKQTQRRELPLPASHPTPASFAGFVSGGRFLVGIDRADRRVVKRWDSSTGEEQVAYRGHLRPVRVVAVSPDGRRVAAADGADAPESTRIVVWDMLTGDELHVLDPGGSRVESLAFSSDGELLASGHQRDPQAGGMAAVRVWEVGTGRTVWSAGDHKIMVTALAFSPDAKTLATAAHDRRLAFRDATTGEVHQSFACAAGVTCVTYSPDGRRVAVLGPDGVVVLVDPVSGQEVYRLRPTVLAQAREDAPCDPRVAFSPDGLWLISTDRDGQLHLWDGGR